jgi:hypothetical protein
MGRFLDGYAMVLDSIGERSAEVARCNGRVATSIATAERLRAGLPSEPGRLVDLIA